MPSESQIELLHCSTKIAAEKVEIMNLVHVHRAFWILVMKQKQIRRIILFQHRLATHLVKYPANNTLDKLTWFNQNNIWRFYVLVSGFFIVRYWIQLILFITFGNLSLYTWFIIIISWSQQAGGRPGLQRKQSIPWNLSWMNWKWVFKFKVFAMSAFLV